VLGDQDSATEWFTTATPIPESVMVSGELVALLATWTLPVTLPAAAGVNVVDKLVVCPGFKITPETPVALNPAPVTLTLEIVTAAVPALVSVTVCVPVAATFTLPKLTEETLELSNSVEAAVTVKVAGLLVALPALLETVTVNCAVAVMAGVV
jgi:hypothetical protein